jgi:hypothetical protein
MRLPKRVYTKFLATKDMEVSTNQVGLLVILNCKILIDLIQVLVSQIRPSIFSTMLIIQKLCNCLVATLTGLNVNWMAWRKFKLVVSMQRYSKFNWKEHEFLLLTYPDLQIAYLEEELARKEGGDPCIFSPLIDGHSEFIPETG